MGADANVVRLGETYRLVHDGEVPAAAISSLCSIVDTDSADYLRCVEPARDVCEMDRLHEGRIVTLASQHQH